ncbi:MAG TPA: PIN domain-containing protein [Candidatus Paceibacterota bacterium]|nr:PIN domain-containing protein [Candidatus Paceibacterota bacterium]HRZ54351.1 PIN domain-containing protein [Candidatus Paceibacterota bacterium]
MNYLDANFIAALHFNVVGQTETAERYVRKSPLPFLVSGLAELEARRAFVRRTGQTRSEAWEVLSQQLETGRWLRYPVAWDPTATRTVELIKRFGARVNAGLLDTMHVALAQLSGCTWFLSFDTSSNARVLAASARLKVFPDLLPGEKAKLAR